MIIDFTSGAVAQLPTALPMGVWNWSIVLGADVTATVSESHTLFGTDTQSFGLNGTDTTSFDLFGSDDENLPLTGG